MIKPILPYPLQIQFQQFFQDLFIGQVMRPAVGVVDSGIQFLVRQVEPGGTRIVEVGELRLQDIAQPPGAILTHFNTEINMARTQPLSRVVVNVAV